MADLMDGFEGSPKPSRNNGPETNRNRAETSMKPSETKVAGHRRNRETAPLKGAVAGFAAARTNGRPNICRTISLERDFPAKTLAFG
jgi:hypothetical protein